MCYRIFIVVYVIFAVLIFANKFPEKIKKFPEKIKKFEKIKYLTLMIILLLGEIIYIGSVMYDFN